MKLRLLLAAGLLLPACVQTPESFVETDEPDIRVVIDEDHAFVLTRDLDNTTGSGAMVHLDQQSVLADDLGLGDWIGNNTAAFAIGSELYIIDKTTAAITVIDPQQPETPVRQFSAGAGTNPESIVLANGKAYIPRYDSTHLLVADPETGAELATIDFSEFATSVDPYSEMSAAVTAAGKVWVAVQRMDRQPPPAWWNASTEPTGSYVVSIDPETDAIADRILLGDTNPTGLRIDPKTGWIAVEMMSGIELINPQTAASEGWLIEPWSIANGIFFSAMTTDQVFVITGEYPTLENGDVDWANDIAVLAAVDRATGAVTEVTRSPEGYFALSCLEVSPRNLVVACAGPGYRVTKPGLRIFDTASHQEVTTKPLTTSLPPVGVVFYPVSTTEVVP